MTRGGDRGGRRPKLLPTALKKSYILTPDTDRKIRAWAIHLDCSESEALRRILGAIAAPQTSP